MASITFAQSDPQMYIKSNGGLMPIFNTDGLACDHWVIWLYPDGTLNPSSGGEWGAVVGASATEVQSKYDDGAEMQRRTDDILNHHGQHLMGYKVHVGPVCIVKGHSSDSHLADDFKSSDELFDHGMDAIMKAISMHESFADALKGNPSDSVMGYGAKEADEYLDHIEDALARVQKLRDQLEDVDANNYASVDKALNDANKEWQGLDQEGAALAQKAPPSAADEAMAHNWIVVPNGNNSEVTLQLTKKDSTGKGVSIDTARIPYSQIASVSPIHDFPVQGDRYCDSRGICGVEIQIAETPDDQPACSPNATECMVDLRPFPWYPINITETAADGTISTYQVIYSFINVYFGSEMDAEQFVQTLKAGSGN